MAEQFLTTLPKVSISDLPADCKTCIICTDEYNTPPETDKPAEQPVRLPCLHIVGANCIAKWLMERSSSCPCCRREFFHRASTKDILEIGDDRIWMENRSNTDINAEPYSGHRGLYGASDRRSELELRVRYSMGLHQFMLHPIPTPGWRED